MHDCILKKYNFHELLKIGKKERVLLVIQYSVFAILTKNAISNCKNGGIYLLFTLLNSLYHLFDRLHRLSYNYCHTIRLINFFYNNIR